jgi:hypothetical protein
LPPEVPSKKKWCGNSKIDVEIQTGKDATLVTTLASIVVPTSLTLLGDYNTAETKLIKKTEQGLILTLDGKAKAQHLGTIYNYDEDDNSQIFIPYLYISSIEYNLDMMNVQMSRTFKGPNDFTFNVVPVKDVFGTPLCECQKEMLLERLQQNLIKRISILTVIAKEITKEVNNVDYYNSEITKYENDKPNLDIKKSLLSQEQNKIKECEAIKETIAKLNKEIVNANTDLNTQTSKMETNQENIKHGLLWYNYYKETLGDKNWNNRNNKTINLKNYGDSQIHPVINALRNSVNVITEMNDFKLKYSKTYPKIKTQIQTMVTQNNILTDLSEKEKAVKKSVYTGLISSVKLLVTEYNTLSSSIK